METTGTTDDKGFGLGLLFAALALGGALLAAVGSSQATVALGFMAAVALGCLAIAAMHVWSA